MGELQLEDLRVSFQLHAGLGSFLQWLNVYAYYLPTYLGRQWTLTKSR